MSGLFRHCQLSGTARTTTTRTCPAGLPAAWASTTGTCTHGTSDVRMCVAGTYAWAWSRPVSRAVAWSAAMAVCRSAAMGVCRSAAAVWAWAISSSAGGYEAMATPAMVIAPVPPGADAQEDAVIEVTGAVEAHRCTAVGCVVVVAVGADRRRTTDVDGDLRVRPGSHGHKGKERRCTEERFPCTSKGLDAALANGGHRFATQGGARWESDFH
jgi:hypothetical protein